MAHVTAEEEAALNEVMQMLEAQPLESTSSVPVLPFTNDNQIPAQREKLAVQFSFVWQIKRSHRRAAHT